MARAAVDLRAREAVGVDERDERALEDASGDGLAVPAVVVEDAPRVRGPPASRIPREEGIERCRTGEAAVLRLVERVLQVAERHDGGEVEQRASRRRHRDAVLDRPLVVRKQHLVHNDYLPKMEIDPQTYAVRADGQLLTCDPATVLPMAQRYFLF